MGYTHYWNFKGKTDTKAFSNRMKVMSVLAQKIVDTSNVDVSHEYNQPYTPPTISPGLIRFNGKGDEGHETFMIDAGIRDFNFCKTARKPYDEIVVACLFAMQTVFPKTQFTWSSDGDPSDHIEGYELFLKATKYDGPKLLQLEETNV